MFSFFIIIVLIIFPVFGCAHHSPGGSPQAIAGIIDLSSWNFQNNGVVKLDGEWEIYWERFLRKSDFNKNQNRSSRRLFSFPGKWNNFKINGKKLKGNGFATFRLKVIINNPGKHYGLKIKEMASAYRLWVDDLPVSSNGIIGKSRKSMAPQYLPKIALFKPEVNEFDIVLQISNFYDYDGGPFHSIYLGLEEQIIRKNNQNLAYDVFHFSILILIGFYHLVLFKIYREEISFLFFGILCLLIALRTILMGERLLIYLFPQFPWFLAIILENLTTFFYVPAFMHFINSLYPREKPSVPALIFTASTALISISFLCSPLSYRGVVFIIFQLTALAAIAYIIFFLVSSVRKNRQGSLYFLSGFLILSLTGINDIFYDHNIINTGYYLMTGQLVFVLSMSAFIHKRFKAINEKLIYLLDKVEELTKDKERREKEKDRSISYLSFKEKGKTILIHYDKIIYLTANGRKTVIHTEEKDYETPLLISKVMAKIPDYQFLRVHKKHIINLKFLSSIKHLHKGQYLLYLNDSDETVLNIGKKYINTLKNLVS